MTAATIKRGAPARRPTKRKAKKVPVAQRILAQLPPVPERAQRWAGYAVVALVGALALTAATLLGLPQAAGVALAELTGRAGFRLERIELTGVDRMERLTVYAIAAEQTGQAMALVDLGAIRAELMRQGWIAEARVSRRLPNTLLIDVVERKPAAVWQQRGTLTLIDAAGVQLEPVALDAMPALPLVIGPDANVQFSGLERLTARVPALRPMIAGATWNGKRRWDLRFQSGETLALPEGEAAAERALTKFARLDRESRLLGRGFTRFDMRVAGKMFVRRPSRPRAIDQIEGEADGADAG